MKLKLRNVIQIIITLAVIAICFIYYLYIRDIISMKILSVGDMNPYGGWSALKSAFIDISYRFRGISKSIALTIAIISTSLLMGRFFCGFICPIGALQDFFKYIGKKLNIKEMHLGRSRHFNPEIIKYLILIFVLVLSILKMGIVVSVYSPWIAYLNIFMGFKFIRGTWILFLIIIVSLFVKRIFCRLFCPLGAVQALFYAIGPLKIVSSTGCKECKKCISNCPVDIDNAEYVEKTGNTSSFKNINQIKNINNIKDIEISPECINCLECTNSECFKGGEGYTIKFAGKTIKSISYVIISMIILLGIYFILPIVPLSTNNNIIEQIGIIENGTYIGESMGFGGKIIVEIYVSDNKINKIFVDKHSETSGYYEEVFKIISGEIVEEQNIGVDSVSGATVSSRGMINAVRDAVSKAIDRNK